MKRRGLTMIETLLAIALLTLVVSVAAAWSAIAGRLGTTITKPAQEEAAADAVFRLIQNDLVTGDFGVEKRTGSEPHPPPPRVRVLDGALELRTRAGVIHRYKFDRNESVLQRESPDESSRTLLRDVREMRLSIDETAGMLDIALEIRSGSDRGKADQESTRTFMRRFNFS